MAGLNCRIKRESTVQCPVCTYRGSHLILARQPGSDICEKTGRYEGPKSVAIFPAAQGRGKTHDFICDCETLRHLPLTGQKLALQDTS